MVVLDQGDFTPEVYLETASFDYQGMVLLESVQARDAVQQPTKTAPK